MNNTFKLLIISWLLLTLGACSTLFGPNEQDKLKAKQLQELKNACIRWNEIGNKKYTGEKTYEEELDIFLKNNKISNSFTYYILSSDWGLDITNLKPQKGDMLLVRGGAAKVFQNIPNVGVLIGYNGMYGNEFKFIIKGYHDVDDAYINKDLLLVNDGTYSYESHFGTRTVYSFVIAKSNDKEFLGDVVERMKLYNVYGINSNICNNKKANSSTK